MTGGTAFLSLAIQGASLANTAYKTSAGGASRNGWPSTRYTYINLHLFTLKPQGLRIIPIALP
ncbi:hypothetical protein K449DRAFT_383449 [Hypoxylon sp. EC38]|nr:hypothetical protein K449DRAFT_383449 [Hypoxylon sp. EC38]